MATSAQATAPVRNPNAVRGRFIWHDLMTTDPDAAKAFYTAVVGWGKQDWPGTTPPYTMWMAGETMVGGVMQLPDEAVQMGSPPHWLTYIETPDTDETFAQATKPFVLGPPNVGTPAPTVVPTAAAKATAAAAAPTAPTAAAKRTPTSTAGVTRRIVNTDGRGVALRASPGGDRLPGKGYDEGATVQAFESNGQWTRIQGNDGREGWVLSVTLAP